MSDKDETRLRLLEMIEQKTARIGIIGLGYVGLPLALHFGDKGFHVIGFDLDSKKIDKILHGESYIKHISADKIREMTDGKLLDVTIDFSRLQVKENYMCFRLFTNGPAGLLYREKYKSRPVVPSKFNNSHTDYIGEIN